MKFPVCGRLVVLQGDPTLTRRECSARAIHTMEDGNEGWILCSLTTPAELEFDLPDSLSDRARQQLCQVTEDFPAVTHAAGGLPPSRRIDHRIPLQPGSSRCSFVLTGTITYGRKKWSVSSRKCSPPGLSNPAPALIPVRCSSCERRTAPGVFVSIIGNSINTPYRISNLSR